MRYDCGHDACDICGARRCAGKSLELVGKCLVCDVCHRKAILLAIRMAEQFGGTIIDVAKPCARLATEEGR